MKFEAYQAKKVEFDGSPDWITAMDDNFQKLRGIDQRAKEAGQLLGRYVDEPVGDGKAIYQVVDVKAKTVKLKLCTGMGDDYRVGYWGVNPTVKLAYVQQSIKARDMFAEIFAKKRV